MVNLFSFVQEVWAMRNLGIVMLMGVALLVGCGEGAVETPPSGFDGYVATVQGMT